MNSYFLIGAIFFQISIIFDCIDGYVARIQNTGSIFGIFSDGFVDFLRVFINLYALNISFGENNNLINLFTIYLLYLAFEISTTCRPTIDFHWTRPNQATQGKREL